MNNADRPSYKYAVTQIQTFLTAISRTDPDIPRVNPDGIYGSTTADAVADFQRKYRLAVTGRVDFATWRMLLEEYRIARLLLAEPKKISPFSQPLKNGILQKGDRGDLVRIVKDILKVISVSYPICDLPDNDIFDSQTEKAITELQLIHGLDVNGKIDLLTWNSLADAYNKHLFPL